MNLVIDQGNSYSKIGVFDKHQLIHFDSVKILDQKLLMQIKKNYLIDYVMVSSVADLGREDVIQLGEFQSSTVFELTHHTQLPFENCYQTPQTLGKDRIAAVAGAMSLYPNQNILVIDAGTAITYELLTANHQYLGGNIAPGLQMRFNALSHFTQRLPLLNPSDSAVLMGKNTIEAITAGVQNGIVFEVEKTIETLEKQYPNLITVFTGGDADFFARYIKNPIFVVSNLVLIGLNRILEQNANQ